MITTLNTIMLKIVCVVHVVLLHVSYGAAGSEVRIKSLEVPSHVARGDEVRLRCAWDLSQFDLYSVKWYRNDREFFRYIPSQDILEALTLPGVTVDEQASDAQQVVLRDVQLNSGGRYKCEVLSAYPEFHTADRSSNMVVVEVPEEKPTIHGTQHEYHIGDKARLTCISAKSRPPADLTWFINDTPVPADYLKPLQSSHDALGLEQTRLGLEFEVSRKHFRQGEMTLRCSAKISSLYYKTQQHSVDGQLTYNVPVMESRDVAALSGAAVTPGQLSLVLTQTLILVLMLVA